MSALEITEFHELMAHVSRIAIGDGQVALAFSNVEFRCQLGRPCTKGVHNRIGADFGAVVASHAIVPNRTNRTTQANRGSPKLSALHKKPCPTGWVKHGVPGDEQAAFHTFSQIWF